MAYQSNVLGIPNQSKMSCKYKCNNIGYSHGNLIPFHNSTLHTYRNMCTKLWTGGTTGKPRRGSGIGQKSGGKIKIRVPNIPLAKLGNFHWDSYATYIQEHNLQDSKAREQRGSQKMQAKAAKKRKSRVCGSTLMVPIDQILIKGLWVHWWDPFDASRRFFCEKESCLKKLMAVLWLLS